MPLSLIGTFARHVPGRIQPEQPVADGADHRHGLRGRRRDRDDREHLALHRGGRAPLDAALKGAGQIGFTIISLTVSLIAVLIPLLFMRRCGRAAVPRVRDHAGGHHPDLGRGLADPGADAVRAPAQAARPRGKRPCRSARRAGFDRMIAWYGGALTWVLEHQRLTLMVAVATLAVTAAALHRDPQGVLPRPGHRPDPGHLGGQPSRSPMRPWPTGSRRWPPRSSRIRTSQSLSSFIGVDGNNVTLNSGRFLINLKPRDERSATVDGRHPAPAARDRRRAGHHAVHAAGAGPDARQHRQPHPVPIHPGERRLRRARAPGRRSSWPRCASSRSSRTWSATRRTTAWRPTSPSTATPPRGCGVSVGTVDNALYDAFGQRIVSTIFTQSNQYRVILEADPSSYSLDGFAQSDLRAVGRRRPGAALGASPGSTCRPGRC